MVRANGESSTRNADRIYDELRERILSLRIQPGAVVDEARIVSDIGTSPTPVREAIIRLVSEGLLRRDGRQIRVSAFEVDQLRALFEPLTLLSRATNRDGGRQGETNVIWTISGAQCLNSNARRHQATITASLRTRKLISPEPSLPRHDTKERA